MPYSFDVSLPDSCPEPESLLSTYAVTSTPTVTAAEGKANISFSVDLTFLYITSDGAVSSYQSKTDISHEIAADNMTADSVCRGNVCIDECSCELTTDKNGEMRVIEVDLTYIAAEAGVYVSDMYSTEYESKQTYGEMTLRHALPVFNTHFSVSGSAEGEYEGDVLFATAECGNYQLTNENSGTVITGDIDIYTVINGDGELEGQTATVPFRAILQYTMNEGGEYFADVSVGMPTVRTDKNTLYADAELYVSVYGTEYETVKTVSTMTISDTPVNKEKPSLRLYRSDPDETDWDTAKKYRVSVDELQRANAENKRRIYIIP